MRYVRDSEVIENGTNWLVNEVKDFWMESNQWYTPEEIQLVINTGKFNCITKDLGSSDHGITEYRFKLKSEEELLKEKQEKDLQYQISLIEKKFNVKLQIL